MATDRIVLDESHYRDGYTAETERLHPPTPLTQHIDAMLPEQPWPLIVALLITTAGAARLGWLARELFPLVSSPYHLVWLVPIVTFLVAWGNGRYTTPRWYRALLARLAERER